MSYLLLCFPSSISEQGRCINDPYKSEKCIVAKQRISSIIIQQPVANEGVRYHPKEKIHLHDPIHAWMTSFKDVYIGNGTNAKLKADQKPESAYKYTPTHIKTIK